MSRNEADVVVVGAGATGLAIALECRARGFDVVLIDEGVGMSASTAAAGMTAPVMETLTMAKSAIQKIAMNPSENIAYDKLVLSQENVRRVKDGITIEQLAEDIGRRKLLQSLNVRPVLDGNGSAWRRTSRSPASSTAAERPRRKRTRLPRTSIARTCIRSTSFAHSRHSGSSALTWRRSPPGSLCRRRPSSSG